MSHIAPQRQMSQPFTSTLRRSHHVPSSHWIIGASLVGFHKDGRVRWTPRCEPLTSMGQQKQSRRGVRESDELWGTGVIQSVLCRDTEMPLMSWVVGVWIVWPHSTCSQEKQAKTPVLDKGCHGNLSPLGHEISGESTERLPLPCVCVEIHKKRKTVMSSLLFRPYLAQDELVKRPVSLSFRQLSYCFSDGFPKGECVVTSACQEIPAFQHAHSFRMQTGYVGSWL